MGSRIDSSFINAVTDAIEHGDMIRAAGLADELLFRRLDAPSDGSLRDLRYHYVSYVCLIAMAADRGGMDTEAVYRVCGDYTAAGEALCDQDELRRLVHDLILRFARITAAIHEDGRRRFYAVRVAAYAAEHLHQPIRTEDIAASLGVSRCYLSTAFRSETGETISAYIRRRKISEAIRLLTSDSLSINEVAESLGFSSQSHFTRVFREATGTTPLHYRRSGLLAGDRR